MNISLKYLNKTQCQNNIMYKIKIIKLKKKNQNKYLYYLHIK